MSASGQRLVLALLLATCGCSHSALIFEPEPDAAADAGEDAGENAAEDAGTDAFADASPGLDAGDASGEQVGPGDAAVSTGAVRALASHEHTGLQVEQGASYGWGRNNDGQLGLGHEETPVLSPLRLPRAAGYVQLCAGETHSCGVRADGELDCWGGNGKGQLGLGDRVDRAEPTPLRIGIDFTAVSCGGEVTCAIGKDARLYCWGDNFEGQGGQGDPAGAPDLLMPARVGIEAAIAEVSVGQGHVCALTQAAALYCWGRNTQGQLGLGPAPEQIRVPTQLPGSALYSSVGAGQEHTCAVRKDQRLFCWGRSLDGRLGLGATAPEEVLEPTQVGSLADYQRVQANWFHTCALRAGGVLMCWGRNIEGQLGVGDVASRDEPVRVSGLESVSVFAVGHFHTCAARSSETFCWGKNDEGQLGLGDAVRRNVPTRLRF